MNRANLAHAVEHMGSALMYWVFMTISFLQAEEMGYSGYVGSMLGALLACIILILMTMGKTNRE